IAFSDYGEYDGGKGGFMRKGNLFFPKRNMKFKVTEKCAIGVMTGIMTLVLASLLLLRMFGYERSESINEKRWQIKEAVNNFSFEDLAESASSLADAFGFSFDYQNNKLGEKSGVSYKNRDEISLMFSWTDTNEVYSEPLYLKGFVASEYKDNEWFEFDSSVYKNEEIFDKFKKYNTYPQELGYLLYKNSGESVNVEIEELRRKSKSFVPTFAADYGDIQFENDTLAYFKKKTEYTCKIPAYNLSEDLSSLSDAQNITISYSELKDDKYLSKIKELAGDILINVETVASRTELVNNNELLLAVILENEYRDFVYDNYLDYPADEDFEEIRLKYGSVLRGDTSTVTSKLQTLDNIRNKIHSNTSYTLTPGKTPQNRDFVNYFLFESQEGYCVHYATAGVMLARMAGIPARYATGYIALDDDFDNYKRYVGRAYEVVLKDNNSHAWAEVYLDGYGWVPYEFTAGYSGSSNEEQQPTSEPATSSTSSSTQTSITTTKTTSSNITKTTTAKQSAKTTTAQTSMAGITSAVNGGKSGGI
ncbi:MAG: transglutaminase domain-containing protein, partial [Clostridia bacterium]|nr:transglutaminase domain-containing protein [Clostridia bacterium]